MNAPGPSNGTLRRARTVVTFPIAFLGIAPLFADLNASHVVNPDWPPHARLHVVWLISTNALVIGFALFTLWRGPALDWARFQLATLLSALVLAGFFVAGGTRSLYGGSFADDAGVPPLVGGAIEGNLAGFTLMALWIAGTTAWAWRGRKRDRGAG